MKIPLEKEPFAPVSLSRAQEQQLQWLADAVVDETLAENDEFVDINHRVLDKKKWKQVMARENVKIYKRHGKGDLGGCTPDVKLLDSPQWESRAVHWRVPKTVGVGTIAGSVDDLLYGRMAPTHKDSQVRTSYIEDDVADSRVLATVLVPCEEQPLRTLVVRWSLLQKMVNNFGVAPRDVVNMEATGTRRLRNGQRVGYIVSQSVTLPECPELAHLGIIRSRFSSCFVFRDAGNGSVELYMRGFIQPGGSLSDDLAVRSGCTSLITTYRLMICAQNKKLSWMMRQAAKEASASGRALVTTKKKQSGDQTAKGCGLCERDLSTGSIPFSKASSSATTCQICAVLVCSRCVDKRKLTHVRSSMNGSGGGEVVKVSAKICKPCITKASTTSAMQIAQREYVRGSSGSSCNWSPSLSLASYTPAVSLCGTAADFSASFVSQPRDVYSITSYAATDEDSPVAMSYESDGLHYDELIMDEEEDNHSSSSAASATGSSTNVRSPLDDVHERLFNTSIHAPNRRRSSTPPPVPPPVKDPYQHKLQLWQRMNELQITADQTYLLTTHNSNSMRHGRKVTFAAYGQ